MQSRVVDIGSKGSSKGMASRELRNHLAPVVKAGDIVGVGLVGMSVPEMLIGGAVLGCQIAMKAAEPSHKPVHGPQTQ